MSATSSSVIEPMLGPPGVPIDAINSLCRKRFTIGANTSERKPTGPGDDAEGRLRDTVGASYKNATTLIAVSIFFNRYLLTRLLLAMIDLLSLCGRSRAKRSN